MKHIEPKDKKLVEKFIKINKDVFGIEHDYHEVQANRFKHLDSKFYSNTREMAEGKGFQLIGDIEDVTLKNQTPNPRTFIRTMSNLQNNTVCAFYHVKPRFPWNLMFLLKSLRPTKIVEFETFFDNNSLVITSNTPEMSRKDCYETINSYFHDNKSFVELYNFHLENIDKHIQNNPNIEALPQSNIEKVILFQNKQNEIKRNYMKSIAWVFENDLMKSTLNDKPLVRRMIKYARELEGLESEEQIAYNQAEKLLKPILKNTPLEFRKKTALAINGTEEYAWAINTNNKFSMDDWKLLKKLQPKTKRYPVITCLWQSNYQEGDDSWEDIIQDAELFDRFNFKEESDQCSDDCSPESIIQRVQYVDLEYEIKEMIDDYNLSTYSDIIESLEQNLDTLRVKFCNDIDIDKHINTIRANIMLKIKLQQIKGKIDLERERV